MSIWDGVFEIGANVAFGNSQRALSQDETSAYNIANAHRAANAKPDYSQFMNACAYRANLAPSKSLDERFADFKQRLADTLAKRARPAV